MATEVKDAVALTKPVFKVAEHQVAGNGLEDGRVGSLIDDYGRFHKPLQDAARGDKEDNIYPSVPPSVQKFFPKFYGTTEIKAPNGSGIVGGEVNILNREYRFISSKRNYHAMNCIRENVFGLLF